MRLATRTCSREPTYLEGNSAGGGSATQASSHLCLGYKVSTVRNTESTTPSSDSKFPRGMAPTNLLMLPSASPNITRSVLDLVRGLNDTIHENASSAAIGEEYYTSHSLHLYLTALNSGSCNGEFECDQYHEDYWSRCHAAKYNSVRPYLNGGIPRRRAGAEGGGNGYVQVSINQWVICEELISNSYLVVKDEGSHPLVRARTSGRPHALLQPAYHRLELLYTLLYGPVCVLLYSRLLTQS